MKNQNKSNETRRTLAQKFNIRINKGKRDMVWEQKRQLKFAKYEQLMQEEQQYYEQQLSPKMTPSNYNNYNNDEKYQRNSPNNQQRTGKPKKVTKKPKTKKIKTKDGRIYQKI